MQLSQMRPAQHWWELQVYWYIARAQCQMTENLSAPREHVQRTASDLVGARYKYQEILTSVRGWRHHLATQHDQSHVSIDLTTLYQQSWSPFLSPMGHDQSAPYLVQCHVNITNAVNQRFIKIKNDRRHRLFLL